MSLNIFLFYVANIIAVVLITDLVGAFGHWVMDSYGNPNIPILGQYIFQPNIDHHNNPNSLSGEHWISLISTSVIPVLLIDLFLWLIWELNWQVIMGSVLLVNSNLIHKWCHCKRSEKHWVVNFLHDYKILQTPHNHALHHQGNQDQHYAAMTNVTNPLLEYFKVWRQAEKIIYILTGIRPLNRIRIDQFNVAKIVLVNDKHRV